MNYFILIPGISLLINIFLWSYVFAIRRESRISFSFLILSASMAIWELSDIFLWSDIPANVSKVILKIGTPFAISCGILLLFFIYTLIKRKLDFIFYSFSFIYLASVYLIEFTDLYFKPELNRFYWGSAPVSGPLMIYVLLFAILLPAIFSIYLIINKYIKTKNLLVKKQIKIIFIGISFTVSIIFIMNLFIPHFLNIKNIPQLGSSLIGFFNIFIFISISKYRFLSYTIDRIAYRLYSRTNDSVVVFNDTGSIIEINDRAKFLLNINNDEIPSLKAEDIFTGDYLFEEDYQEKKVESRNKNKIIYINQISLIESGIFIGKLVILRDFTEIVEVKEALDKSEEEYRITLNSLSDYVHVIDRNYIITLVNTSFNELLREHWDDPTFNPVGKDSRKLFSFLDKSVYLEYEKVFKTGKMLITQENHTYLDKTHITETRRIPVFENGKVLKITTILHNITKRKTSEDKIEEQFKRIEIQNRELQIVNDELTNAHIDIVKSNLNLINEKERLSVILQSIGEAVVTIDINGKIENINKIAEDIYHLNSHEVIGKSINEICEIINKDDNSNALDSSIKRVLKDGENIGIEKYTLVLKKISIQKNISLVSNPLKDDNETVYGAVLAFRDITEIEKLQEELFKTSKIESLGVFAGGIAHDFNNLLTGIIGNISLLKLSSDNKSSKMLSEAEKAALRAKDLTMQLLTFSKGGSPVKKITSIKKLIVETSEFVLRGSSVKVHFKIDESLWNVDIDEGQISQVLHNLVLNAMQSMKGGGNINISAENNWTKDGKAQTVKKGKYVQIKIEDFGYGIDSTHINNVFDPFFTTKEEGTGLGLSVTYSIIKKHNGNIEVQSKKGEGTVFTINLPASSDFILSKNTISKKSEIKGGKILLMMMKK